MQADSSSNMAIVYRQVEMVQISYNTHRKLVRQKHMELVHYIVPGMNILSIFIPDCTVQGTFCGLISVIAITTTYKRESLFKLIFAVFFLHALS